MTTSVSGNSYFDHMYWDEDPSLPPKQNDKLGQEDFFRLLTSQMSMQDPTKPVENEQMIAQMTNFTIAEGITGLTEEFREFSKSMTSNQALQASSLVGQKVLIPSDVSYFNGEREIDGVISLGQTADAVRVNIKNEAGEIVHSMDMGTLPEGQHKFAWDGVLPNGETIKKGDYSIEVLGNVGGKNEALPALTYGYVESVSMGGSAGLFLNLESIGRINLKDVIQVTSGA